MRRAVCADAWLPEVILLLPHLFPFAVIVWEQVEAKKKGMADFQVTCYL